MFFSPSCLSKQLQVPCFTKQRCQHLKPWLLLITTRDCLEILERDRSNISINSVAWCHDKLFVRKLDKGCEVRCQRGNSSERGGEAPLLSVSADYIIRLLTGSEHRNPLPVGLSYTTPIVGQIYLYHGSGDTSRTILSLAKLRHLLDRQGNDQQKKTQQQPRKIPFSK